MFRVLADGQSITERLSKSGKEPASGKTSACIFDVLRYPLVQEQQLLGETLEICERSERVFPGILKPWSDPSLARARSLVR